MPGGKNNIAEMIRMNEFSADVLQDIHREAGSVEYINIADPGIANNEKAPPVTAEARGCKESTEASANTTKEPDPDTDVSPAVNMLIPFELKWGILSVGCAVAKCKDPV
jgi:hypothetical protein